MAKAKTNVEVHGRERFRIRRTVEIKRTDGSVEKKMKAFYGTSETDAKKKYEDWLKGNIRAEEEKQRLEAQAQIDYESITLGERAEDYVENVLLVSQKYATGTKSAYFGSYKNYFVGSDLAKMRLSDVTALDVQKFYNGLDVSQQKLKAINKFLSAFCKWLCLNGYSFDFMAAVELPKKDDNSRHDDIVVWTPDEIEMILSSMRQKTRHKQFFLVHLLLYTGMRISEALGLKYSDIRDGIIHVERQFYLGEEKEPKWNSKRLIPMHEDLLEPFRIHKEWHENEMEKNGYSTEYIFTTSTGHLFHQSSVRKALKRFYDANGIPYKNIHAYRATFCTQLCRCGVPLEVASKLMGHKSVEVTAAHYALVKKDTLEDAIAMLSY